MGFCSDDQYELFLRQCPAFEDMLVEDGILLVKFWFSVSRAEQRTRFAIRQVDPVRQWKLSPTDLASLGLWDAYTTAKVAMFRATDTKHAPWTVVKSNDKRRARLEAIRSLLERIDYDRKDPSAVGQPDPLIVGAADTSWNPERKTPPSPPPRWPDPFSAPAATRTTTPHRPNTPDRARRDQAVHASTSIRRHSTSKSVPLGARWRCRAAHAERSPLPARRPPGPRGPCPDTRRIHVS